MYINQKVLVYKCVFYIINKKIEINKLKYLYYTLNKLTIDNNDNIT